MCPRPLEEEPRLDKVSLAEEGTTDLEHQLVVVVEAEFDDAVEGAERTLDLPEHELRLAEAGERVLVFRVHPERGIERGTCPRVFLAGELRVADPDVEFDRLRVAEEPLAKEREGVIVTCFVVQLVGLLIVLVGAEEGLRHMMRPPGGVACKIGRASRKCKRDTVIVDRRSSVDDRRSTNDHPGWGA